MQRRDATKLKIANQPTTLCTVALLASRASRQPPAARAPTRPHRQRMDEPAAKRARHDEDATAAASAVASLSAARSILEAATAATSTCVVVVALRAGRAECARARARSDDVKNALRFLRDEALAHSAADAGHVALQLVLDCCQSGGAVSRFSRARDLARLTDHTDNNQTGRPNWSTELTA